MRATVFVLLLLLLPLPRAGQAEAAVMETLLSARQAPEGVVFEIMAWRDHTWDWAAPRLRAYVDRLRARFPGLEVALISHGAELFDLTRQSAARRRPAIDELARLGAEGLDIHVCGEYAAWKRLGQKDFLDFVDVAASGSAQLADYLELGFAHVRLEAPHAID